MRFVEFSRKGHDYLVVPEQVTYLAGFEDGVRIYFAGDHFLGVDGTLKEVALKLQGRDG
jgi:hypothetical protein